MSERALILEDTLQEFHFEDRKGKYAPFIIMKKAENLIAWWWHNCPGKGEKLNKLVTDEVISSEFRDLVERQSPSLVFMVQQYTREADKANYKHSLAPIVSKIIGLTPENMEHLVSHEQEPRLLSKDRDDSVRVLEEHIAEELDTIQRKEGLAEVDFVIMALNLVHTEESKVQAMVNAYLGKNKSERTIPDAWDIRCFWEYRQSQKEASKEKLKQQNQKWEELRDQKRFMMEGAGNGFHK